jgi:bisphosphoglycerate-dependent phosphoglycerate mutase
LTIGGRARSDAIAAQKENRCRMTRIILVRHAQTEWNRIERFRGRADVTLNKTGLAQAEAVARRLAAEGEGYGGYPLHLKFTI